MSISHYLDQLLEDIEALMERKPPCKERVMPEKGSRLLFEEFMMELEDHILEGKGLQISRYTGISVEHLPEGGLLSDELVELLYSGIMNLLDHYQYYPEFHESVPVRMCYEKLREDWEEIMIPMIDCCVHHDCCYFDVSDCPFPGVCKGCLENDENYLELMAELEREAEEEERDDDRWDWNDHR